MSTLRLVASNGPTYENYRPRQITPDQRKFLNDMEKRGVSVLATVEAENILVGNISNFAAAAPSEIMLMREEGRRRKIRRYNGEPL